jgi:putative membrane protein
MRRSRLPGVAGGIAVAALAASPAQAHETGAAEVVDLWLALAIILPLLVYALGVARLWRAAGRGRGARYATVAAFTASWAALVLALASPLHALADRSFFGHMIVHLLLMTVAAPLLVLARPLAAFAWAAPRGPRAGLARRGPARASLGLLRWLTGPIVATTVQLVVLSAWHLPELFDFAVGDRRVHTLQHVMLAASAMLFWWAVLERSRGGRREGLAVVCLLVTMLHGIGLGALLTLAAQPWYVTGSPLPPPFGLDALEDQQLGGLVMWVPGGLAYAAAALVLLARLVRGAGSSAPWTMRHDTAFG